MNIRKATTPTFFKISLMRVFLIVVLIMGFNFVAVPVQAHFLETDGDIGITLHVDPQDDPIIGEPATLYPDLTDKNGSFDPNHCTCTLRVSFNDQNIGEFAFVPNESIAYQFDKKGLYGLDFSGKSTHQSFADFSIHYDLKVTREADRANNINSKNQNIQFVPYLVLGGGIVGFLTIIGQDIIKQRRNQKPDLPIKKNTKKPPQ